MKELTNMDNTPINNFEDAKKMLTRNGFKHHIYPTEKEDMRDVFGLYIFTFDCRPRNFQALWKKHKSDGKNISPLSGNSKSDVMYIGESRGALITDRLRAHFAENDSYVGTGAMKLNSKVLNKSKLAYTCHCFIIEGDSWKERSFITAYEKMLHEKLNPEVGKSG